MPFPADDLEWQFRDSGGVLVTLGGAETYGHLDTVDEALFADARVIGASMSLAYATGSLDARVDDAVTVDGTTYSVRQVLRRADGTTVALLAED